MEETLRRCLEDLEERIDPAQEERLLARWRAFAERGSEEEVFDPRRGRLAPPRTEWPAIRVNEAIARPEAMLLHQYGACSRRLASGDGLLLWVRANYGTSILPLLFGAEPFVMPDETDTLPTSRPLPDRDAVRRAVERGMPGLDAGYGAPVMEMADRFARVAAEYPKIGRFVHVVHPDLQGPLDVCEVVWGSGLFEALYDDAPLVHALLDLVTRAYEAMMRRWLAVWPPGPDGVCHWGFWHRGAIMLRLDSATNLSPAMVDAFSRPYDQRLLDAFGGGALHFCGRGDHFLPSLAAMRGLTAVNLSQPELNDMERVFAATVDRGVRVLGLARSAASAASRRGRALRGLVHVL